MEQLSSLFELSVGFHSCNSIDSFAKTLATHVGRNLEARAAMVWLRQESGGELLCRSRWFEAGLRLEFAPGQASQGILAEMLAKSRARRLDEEEIEPEMFPHLAEADRERVATALYAPIPTSKDVAGVLEVLNKRTGGFTANDAGFVEEACRLAGRVLDALRAVEVEKWSSLQTIERLTALYDVASTFSSTLELEDLLPIMAEKIQGNLGALACNFWLLDSETNELLCAQQAGDDPTTNKGSRLQIGEGLAGGVAQTGQARLVSSAQDEPGLEARLQASEEYQIQSLMCAPLLKEERVLGVVEIVNRSDGKPFDEDDLFYLTNMCEQASNALNNANLLQAERKVHTLDALLAISKEITSTLNLDHVLTTVVHQAATVVPFDQCVIGLYDRHRFILGAVSGEAEVPRTREMEQLRELLAWVAEQSEAVSAHQTEEGWKVKPEGANAALVRYLEEQGLSGFYAMPLRDEQGTVGVLALLSNTAEFLSESHLEVLAILASQTTVAIRNARLYQEVPLLSIWQPMLKGKRKLEGITASRWLEIASKAGIVVLLLIVVPWKHRIQTNATVVPAERRIVSAEVSGVVQQVPVREGQRVSAGDELARLDDSDDKIRLERALTDLALAHRQLAEAEEKRDWAGAGQARLNMDLHQAEVNLCQEKVDKAHLRASIHGVVVTPKVEEKTGKLLKVGDAFCELVDQDHLAVEMNVPETDISLIRTGAPVALKLNAFPTLTLRGTVERVSSQTISAEGEQFFVTRALFPNPDVQARDGMAGQAKITSAGGWFHSGWYPVGYMLLRAPTQWAWRKAWALLP
ncbi:MAG: GAF domain-containing protein [Terriglobia bacterium]|jgi:RND family efflux transporter MFP subunit